MAVPSLVSSGRQPLLDGHHPPPQLSLNKEADSLRFALVHWAVAVALPKPATLGARGWSYGYPFRQESAPGERGAGGRFWPHPSHVLPSFIGVGV